MSELFLGCQLVWMHDIVYGESPLLIDKSYLRTYVLVQCMCPVVSAQTNSLIHLIKFYFNEVDKLSSITNY